MTVREDEGGRQQLRYRGLLPGGANTSVHLPLSRQESGRGVRRRNVDSVVPRPWVEVHPLALRHQERSHLLWLDIVARRVGPQTAAVIGGRRVVPAGWVNDKFAQACAGRYLLVLHVEGATC